MDNTIYARWYKHTPNWGDALNKVMIERISGKKLKWVNTNDGNTKQKYIVLGSILQWADEHTILWGPGFIGDDRRLSKKPKKICAVRGPLTREIIINQGFDCPEVYGDPALLYPRLYNPMHIKKKHKIGIIPHYIDAKNPWIQRCKRYGVKIINILDPVNKVVDEILECEKIAASSLHGIIAADAYGVPSTWIELSDKVLGKGFKFRDYFMSVGRKDREPLRITETTRLKEVYNQFYDYKINIDLDKLWAACPFKK
tara:strand:- start:1518 stop:2285 length:768 start_codon:yes stop_codon:yes gene_type:complete